MTDAQTLETRAATLRMLGQKILVRRQEAREMTPGGIVIPDAAKEKPREGEVLKVGPGQRGDDGETQAMPVQVGEQVLFAAYAGSAIWPAEPDLLVMDADEVIAVVESA